MELFGNLALGFAVSLSLSNLLFCFVGVLIGTAVGVLPGLGPAATMSLLLPVTFRMDPASAIIMLAGIYYGAMYGGSVTSILIRVPGEAASVVTCLDGYEMARRGKAGKALGMAAFGSLIAGLTSAIGIALIGPTVAHYAIAFGPPEYTALVTLGLLLVALISQTSFLKSLLMVAAGLFLSTVGVDPVTGQERFTFGVYQLIDGFDVVTIAMGLFGIAELLTLAASKSDELQIAPQPTRLREMLPNKQDWKQAGGPIARGSLLGFVLGLLPGGGAILASFASYVMEKKISRHPETFGTGAMAGLAGPEAANNAAAQGAFIPLLTLGIPPNVVMSILMAALMMQGVLPGPLLMTEQPGLFWGVITSMLIGNIMLIFLNVPLVGLFVRMLRIPYQILSPLIIFFCVIGAYSVQGDSFEVLVMMSFGVLGFMIRRAGLDPAPLVLAFVLGSLFENSIRQSLLLGDGRFTIFVDRSVSAVLLSFAVLLFLVPTYMQIRRILKRSE